ncbi:MAG: dihydrodipicolinate synthase family protein [Devosia sp.]|nr:dihydrodipicolinate synthase family protein [Devosia sp.]
MTSPGAAISGVFCAAATPVGADLTPDLSLFGAHCRWLLDEGCDGIALLGTTGEANSFSGAERRQILEAAVAAGISPDRLLPGTGTTAIPDTVELTRHALGLGVTHVVMLPPYYYKGISDDGLFAAYAETIERIGEPRLRIVLYHIPQMSGVPISLALIERLVAAYPQTVVGIKDSAGDFEHMKAMVSALPGFSVLAGADPLLLPLLQAGGAGCITATSNIVARNLATVFRGARDAAQADAVAAAQARIVAYRTLSNQFGAQIATIKAMIAAQTGAPAWTNVRPPLVALGAEQRRQLASTMAGIELPEPD